VRELSQFTDQYLGMFRKLAIKNNTNIIGGSHFLVENDTLYNVAHLFRRDGTIDRQFKLHITPHERKWWGVRPGDELNVMPTDKGKIAINICYDIEFPELARISAHRGAQVIFVPFNTDDQRAFLRVKYCAQARAVENQVYVAIAGCVGNLPKVENLDIHYAQSAIFTPSDIEFHREAIATQSSANTEMVISQQLDLNLLGRNREAGSVQMWKDRRTDLYAVRNFRGSGESEDF
jgi:predicted amidohydrolase